MNRSVIITIFICFLSTFSIGQDEMELDENIDKAISRELNTFYELINLSLGSAASPVYHQQIIEVAKDMTYREDSKSIFQFSLNEKLSPRPYSIDSLANAKKKLGLDELRFEIDVFHESMSKGYFIKPSKAYPYVRTILIEKSIALNNKGKFLTSTNQKTAIFRIYKEDKNWSIKIVSVRNSFKKEKIKGNPLEVISASRDKISKIELIKEFELSDFDLDGILNKDDKCPNTPGQNKYSGCPEPSKESLSKLFIPGMNTLLMKDKPVVANYFVPLITYSFIGSGVYFTAAESDFDKAVPFFIIGSMLLSVDYFEAIQIYKKKNEARNLLEKKGSKLGFIDQINLGGTSHGLGLIIKF